jgi:hypothetical protein
VSDQSDDPVYDGIDDKEPVSEQEKPMSAEEERSDLIGQLLALFACASKDRWMAWASAKALIAQRDALLVAEAKAQEREVQLAVNQTFRKIDELNAETHRQNVARIAALEAQVAEANEACGSWVENKSSLADAIRNIRQAQESDSDNAAKLEARLSALEAVNAGLVGALEGARLLLGISRLVPALRVIEAALAKAREAK